MAKIMTVNKITWLILNDLLHMPCINKTMLRLVYILILDICVKDTKAIYKKKKTYVCLYHCTLCSSFDIAFFSF